MSTAVARKLVKNLLTHLRRNNNKGAESRKNTVSRINEWAKRNCDSYDVEELDDGNKLIARHTTNERHDANRNKESAETT